MRAGVSLRPTSIDRPIQGAEPGFPRRLALAALTGATLLCHAQTPPSQNDGPASSIGQNEAKALVAQRAKHETDLFTGSFVYSVPIEGPPARNGSEPHPSLVYSSSGENGWCGVGWNLDVDYIERYTKDGIPIKWDTSSPPLPIKQYDDSKGFLCSLFGRQLRLLLYSGNEYRAEVDTDFTRFIFDPTNNRWDVYDKSGNLFRFGYSYRVINTDAGWTANSTGTFRWALDQIITVTGDQTTITYQTHSTTDPGTARVLYPNLISYNGHTSMNGYGAAQTPTHTIQFQIEARTDKRISYRSGFRVVQDILPTSLSNSPTSIGLS